MMHTCGHCGNKYLTIFEIENHLRNCDAAKKPEIEKEK